MFIFLFSVPSQPLNLSVVAVTNNGFVLQWVRPERPNGRISGYRVYYSSDNFTNVRTINSSEPVVSGEVDGLGKFYKKFCQTFYSGGYLVKYAVYVQLQL